MILLIMTEPENKKETYKIVCFQNREITNVGIQLIHWYTQEEKPGDTYKMTIGVDFLLKENIIKDRPVRMAFWRLAGQERFSFVRGSFYKGGDASIIVYTLLNLEQGKQYVQARFDEIRNYLGSVPVLVVAVDLEKAHLDIVHDPIRNEIKNSVIDKGGLYIETASS